MLDKMISVSPPQKGEAPDSKLAESKILGGSSKSDYKKDFEKALTKKLDQKKESLNSKKEQNPGKEELRADHKDGKKAASKREERDSSEDKEESLGGTKKKVTEYDDQMISMLMASNESKLEIPDSKIEDLAEIEVDIAETNKQNAPIGDTKAAALAQLPILENSTSVINQPAAEISSKIAMPQDLQQLTENLQIQNEQLAEVPQTLNAQYDEVPQALSAQQAELAVSLDAKAMPQMSIEDDLGKEVGFTSELGTDQSNKDMLAKLKAFDGDKATLAENKAQAFEQNVLNRLQNEKILAAPVVAQNPAGNDTSDSKQQDSDQFKDLKSHLFDTNQLHQAAGQSHGEFKTQIAGVSTVEGASMAKLEENREANIKEIMNQAQYLVKRGGGEVTVKMSPEGLGEVQLKVQLLDGKLNIQMQTQSKDAKKLIEESLSDLKSGLAAHRLSLEHVKIDTVNATNADNNTQFQSNLNQGGSEGRTREFWSDFQGNMNNQSGKRSYGESARESNGSLRSSMSASANAAHVARTYGGTKGSSLNRVA